MSFVLKDGRFVLPPMSPEESPRTVLVIRGEPESQLRRVLRQIEACFPMRVALSTPDDIHLETTMYVVDRDYHVRAGAPESGRGAPYLRQVFSCDMSDEVVALRQTRAYDLRAARPGISDELVDACMNAPVTDEEMALLVFGAVRGAISHELQEGFYFQGKRVMDPHKDEPAFRVADVVVKDE